MSVRNYTCPNCSAPVAFASSVTVSAVCGFCRSLVVRRDAAVEQMGLMARLPGDVSPLRIGSRGTFDGHPFTLVGRVRLGYREGSWTEWCADFGNGRWGWVAEAQGVYEVSFEVAPPEDFPGVAAWKELTPEVGQRLRLNQSRLSEGRSELRVGREFLLAGSGYRVRDVKQTEVLGAEGELTFTPTPGRTAVSGDMRGPGASFANVEYSEEGIRMFLGRACRFAELRFEDLRPVPGWTTGPETLRGQSDPINCPQCGAATELRAAGLSMCCVCHNCGATLDTSHPRVQVLATAQKRQHLKPVLAIGMRGLLEGVEYEVIGFLQRRDQHLDRWMEYLLFNPMAGFRWLVSYAGHWTLVETLLEDPLQDGESRSLAGKPFALFARGTAQVTYVLGEFYWQVRVRERTQVADYIQPPEVLSLEQYPDLAEVTWSHGVYQDPDVVYRAFGLQERPPAPSGAYLNQPNPHREKGRTLRWLAPLFLGTYLLIALAGAASKANQVVFDQSWTYLAGASNAPVVSEPFEIGGSHPQGVRAELSAGVENGWLGVDLDLVRVDTQATESASLEVGFYSGYDDGPWQEGRRDADLVVPSVAPGRYRLLLEPEGQPGVSEVTYRVRLVRDVMVWSNVWLGLLGLLAYPAYRWLREHAFERGRWAASDFSPFTPVSEWVESDDD